MQCTYGSFILMKTLHVKNDTNTHRNPRKRSRKRLSLDMPAAFDLSRMIKPRPPIEKRKLEASPSMMYCPFTLYGMKATCGVEKVTHVFK